MFGSRFTGVELSEPEVLSGESEDLVAYRVTLDEMSTGRVDRERHLLPTDLEDIPVGLFLAAIVSSVDRAKLNGYDAVRLMKAEARLAAFHEAQKLAVMVESHRPTRGC